MSRKHLRELFNQRHSKCRFCERCILNWVSDGGVRRAKAKTLFHPRPWMSQAQCTHRLNSSKWARFTMQFANMAEELEELERVRARLEEERLNAYRARKNVRRLYKKFEAQTLKLEEHLRGSQRVDLSDDMDIAVQGTTED